MLYLYDLLIVKCILYLHGLLIVKCILYLYGLLIVKCILYCKMQANWNNYVSTYLISIIFILVYLPHHFFQWKCCRGDFLEPSILLVRGLCVWHGNNRNSGHLWRVQSLPLLLSAYYQPCIHSKDTLSLSPNLHSVVNCLIKTESCLKRF